MWKLVFLTLAALAAVGLGGLVGGFVDMDVNDARARDALRFAVAQHNRGSNDMFLSQVAEVVRVQTQVVSGMKYVITVKMKKTSCRKGSTHELCDQPDQLDQSMAPTYQCRFTIWSRPWLSDIRLLNEEC